MRRRLLRLMAERRTNLRTASLAIERNPTYLHQFIHRGSPRVLAGDDREALAEYFGCSPRGAARPAGDASRSAAFRPLRRSQGSQGRRPAPRPQNASSPCGPREPWLGPCFSPPSTSAASPHRSSLSVALVDRTSIEVLTNIRIMVLPCGISPVAARHPAKHSCRPRPAVRYG